MRILQVHNTYRQRGGEDTVVEREHQVLTTAGHDVAQFHSSNSSSPVSAALSLIQSPWNVGQYWKARQFARQFSPDIAHVHNTWFSMTSSVLAGLAAESVPIVMTLHNYRVACMNGLLYRDGRPCTLCLGQDPLPGLRFRCYRDSIVASSIAAAAIETQRSFDSWEKNVTVFVALTESARERFARAGIPKEGITVKPNFVFDPGNRSLHPSASRSILFVGRLTEEKGIHDLARHWPKHSPLNLRVVGAGPEYDSIRSLYPHITMTGLVAEDDVIREMLSARAIVIPSRSFEGLPTVGIEALSCGLPVLATTVSSAADIARGMSDSLVLPVDPAEWRTTFRRLQDDRWVDEMGRKARHQYHVVYSSTRGLENLERLYNSAMRR